MMHLTKEFVGEPLELGPGVGDQPELITQTRLAIRRFRGNFRMTPAEIDALLPDEHARLDASSRRDKTQRALLARLQLRYMLAQELNCAPQDVRFITTSDGKRLLHSQHDAKSAPPGAQIDFSVTYGAEGYAVCVARGVRVGLDLQSFTPRQHYNFEQLFGGYTERRWRTSLSPVEIWTRMEAFGKMQGLGLAFGLRRLYEVAIKPENADCPCRFMDIRLGQGVSLTLCSSGRQRRVASFIAPHKW